MWCMFQIIGTDPFHLIVGCFQVWVGDQHNLYILAFFNGIEYVALFIQQEASYGHG